MQTVFLILGIAVAATESKKYLGPINTNHVNLSIETAFIFDPKDAYYDITLIKTLKDFLESLEGQISKRTKLRSAPTKHFQLSDFVYELGKHALNYNDQDLRTLTIVMQDVAEDYYPTDQFKKLFYDPRMRSFMKNSLKDWTETNPQEIKRCLKTMYERPTYNESFTNFLYNINHFFTKSELNKLQKLAGKFEKFPAKRTKLRKNIENALNFIIFEKFKRLTFNQTTSLIQELGHLATYVGNAFPKRAMVPDDSFKVGEPAKRAAENMTVFEEMTRKDKKVVHIFPPSVEKFSGSDREDFPVNPNDSLETITKDSDEPVAKLENAENEIVIDKTINVDVNKDGAIVKLSGKSDESPLSGEIKRRAHDADSDSD